MYVTHAAAAAAPAAPLSRRDAFWAALCAERSGESGHFLNIVSSIDDIEGATDLAAIPADLSISSQNMRRMLIRASVKIFYERWDRALYESFADPRGVITTCVWGIYRQVASPAHVVARREHVAAERARRRAELAAGRKEAARKRAVREQEQMLRLGGGDIDKGRRKFVARMHVQKAAKYAKPARGSLALEEKFAAWWASLDSAAWREPMVDRAPQQFATISRSALTPNFSAARPCYLPTPEAARAALLEVAAHPRAAELRVQVTLKWDATADPYAIPSAYVLAAEGPLPLRNHDRLSSPHTFEVTGLHASGGRLGLVTEKQIGASRLFPKAMGFEGFESRNPKIPSQMRVLHEAHTVCGFVVLSRHGGLRVTVRRGKPAADLGAELAALFADATARRTRDRIATLRAEKKIYDAAARAAGLAAASETLGDAAAGAEKKIYDAADRAARLAQLATLRTADVLTEAEFIAAAGRLLR